jgi:hypothetical protein
MTSVEGLEPGVIATDNFNKLGDGMKVNVRQPGRRRAKGGGAGGKKKSGRRTKPKEDAP